MASDKLTRPEIMRTLKISRSAYFRNLEAIRAEDQVWLMQLAQGEFVSEYREAHDMLVGLARRGIDLADNAKSDRDRLEALKFCKEVELDRIRLLGEGPTALAVRKRAEDGATRKQADV